jgi:hypothetical protein
MHGPAPLASIEIAPFAARVGSARADGVEIVGARGVSFAAGVAGILVTGAAVSGSISGSHASNPINEIRTKMVKQKRAPARFCRDVNNIIVPLSISSTRV